MATGEVETEDLKSRSCTICLESFKNPKLLPCFHTFCRNCLDEYVRKRSQKGKFHCPICRQDVLLPSTGVDGLQSNFYIEEDRNHITEERGIFCVVCSNIAVNRCCECEQNLCEMCTKVHNSLKTSRFHVLESIQRSGKCDPYVSNPEYCLKHKEERLRFHCNKCELPICRDCKLTNHEGHDTSDLVDVIQSGLRQLGDSKVHLEQLISAFERTVQQKTQNKEKCFRGLDDVISDINSDTDAVISEINLVRQSSVKEVEKLKETKQHLYDDNIFEDTMNRQYLMRILDEVKTVINERSDTAILTYMFDSLPNLKQQLKICQDLKDMSTSQTEEQHQLVKVSKDSNTLDGILYQVRHQGLVTMSTSEKANVLFTVKCGTEGGTIDLICPSFTSPNIWVGIREERGENSFVKLCNTWSITKLYDASRVEYEKGRPDGMIKILHKVTPKLKESEISEIEQDLKLKLKPQTDTRHTFTCSVIPRDKTVRVVNDEGEIQVELSTLSFPSNEGYFNPVDVCWAQDGGLVIADKGSNSVLLYKSNPDRIRRVKIEVDMDFSPTAVACDILGRIWVGAESGFLYVITVADW